MFELFRGYSLCSLRFPMEQIEIIKEESTVVDAIKALVGNKDALCLTLKMKWICLFVFKFWGYIYHHLIYLKTNFSVKIENFSGLA